MRVQWQGEPLWKIHPSHWEGLCRMAKLDLSSYQCHLITLNPEIMIKISIMDVFTSLIGLFIGKGHTDQACISTLFVTHISQYKLTKRSISWFIHWCLESLVSQNLSNWVYTLLWSLVVLTKLNDCLWTWGPYTMLMQSKWSLEAFHRWPDHITAMGSFFSPSIKF